jgi:light-regulated signal transduction histidine kinase (bacteriophytochrome)
MPETAENNLPTRDVIRHLTHELRQPLSALESIAFYLQMTLGGGQSDVSAQIERLQQMVDNANWVLSDILHLMQIAPANPEAVDVPELANEVLTESWVSDGLDLSAEFAEGLPAAWVDLEQFRHLLRSVLQFFRRSVAEPRAVEFSGVAVHESLSLEFRGNTPGVLPETLFSPLETNQLLSCRRIMENNAGHLNVDTDERGWLRLRLDLPLAPVAP